MPKTARFHPALGLAAAAWLSGCASAITGPDQVIAVSTLPPKPAHCVVENADGAWNVHSAPERISVRRAPGPLSASCRTADGWSGTASVLPGLDGRAVVLGAPTGHAAVAFGLPETGFGIVDDETHALYRYPGELVVALRPDAPPPPADAAAMPVPTSPPERAIARAPARRARHPRG